MIPFVTFIVGGLAFLVVSNGAIHLAMGARHRAVRDELRDARVLLELKGIRASVSARGFLSASVTWFAGDLLVTDRGVVLFPVTRGVVRMKQPAFVIVKEGDEETVPRRWGVNPAVATSGPVRGRSLMGTPRVSLTARGKLDSRWTLHVQTSDIDGLVGALEKFLATEEPGGAYREPAMQGERVTRVEGAPVETPPVRPEFTEGFLHWDPETGFRKSPFTERLGHRGEVVCFESDAVDEGLWQRAREDLGEIADLPFGECYYGASTFAVEPFLAAAPGAGLLTAAEVLGALRARNFQSEHIADLDRTAIPYPGYVGYSINDEVHTDSEGQCLFYREGYDEGQDAELDDDPIARRDAMDTLAVREGLERLVAGPLWYVLLHEDGGTACPLVALFAVGRSKRGGHLIGVASQQVCHNLCD